MNEDYFEKLGQILDHLEKRFPNGNDPFQAITRLCEEAGELAREVNHFENSGIKKQKHGEPNKEAMANEIQDVMRCALQVARLYNIEAEVKKSIDKSIQKIESA